MADTGEPSKIDTESESKNVFRHESFTIPEDDVINLTTNAAPSPKSTPPQVGWMPTSQNPVDESQNVDGPNVVHYRKQRRTSSNNDSVKPQILPNGRPHSMQRPNSYAPSVFSHSQHTEHEHLIPPPSTPHEKSKMTRRYFATVFAIIYAIFLIIFGAVAFIADAVVSRYPLVEAYCITMLGIGTIYFIFLYIDIRVHVYKAKKQLKAREKREQLYQEHLAKINAATEGGLALDPNTTNLHALNLPEWNMPPIQPISHKYCFMTGRHGEFLYLKLGAAWFAFGLLIHSALQISYQVIFLTSYDPLHAKCASALSLALEILFPLYSLLILFFIFKYINVIINAYRGLARLLFMHAIGTALAFWIYTIVRETSDAIILGEEYYPYPYATYKNNNVTLKSNGTNINPKLFDHPECPSPGDLNTIHRNFSPYLYPFIIEFCILIVGIFYMIWANISHCPKKHSAPGHGHNDHHEHNFPLHHEATSTQHGDNDAVPELATIEAHNRANGLPPRPPSSSESDHCETTTEDHDRQIRNATIIYADCHSANRGLFAGLILVILTITFIVLFFVAVHEEYYFYTGVLMNSIFELVVLDIMIITVIIAYFQTSQLDVNHHPISLLDDVLLFIAIPAFFLETTFSMVPAIYNGSYLNIAIIMSQIVQVVIQTPFIIDGLRRCCNDKKLRKKKPGRELITFLTIANVSLWIFYTFSVRTAYDGDERYEFYGYTLWNILNHISLPLIMFYRFHASVCLVDMWRHSYEPEPPAH